MKFRDLLKLSQTNLLRSKLRTFLTVSAVFIGVLTISLTNGVGNGVRSYVDRQLGNLGAENILFVQAKQSQQNPVSTDVQTYDPNRQVGEFNMTLMGADDIARIRGIKNVASIMPLYMPRIEYITRGGQKYQATAGQYIDGLAIEMAAGRTILPSETSAVTVPIRYLQALGFSTAQDAIGMPLTIAFKNAQGQIIERQATIVGMQENSLLGNSDMNISMELAALIYDAQTAAVPSLAGQYQGVFVSHDVALSQEQRDVLEKEIEDAGYSAKTLEDQVGTVSTIIDSIIMVLNVFGGITLLAAAFGIVNTLLMSVNERTSEIGLMKALGANRRMIFSLFAIEAVSIGFWGGLLGIGTSVGIGMVVNRIASQTFLKSFVGFNLLAFPILPLMGVLGGIMLLSLLAGTLPSLKASKLDPIRALRYE